MLPLEQPDRIHVAFDDHRLVANAGLLLPVTLARHLGLGELVDRHVDLGGAPGRANVGDKMLTLVASALAGGDCIDDADAGGTDGLCDQAPRWGCGFVGRWTSCWLGPGPLVHSKSGCRAHRGVGDRQRPTSE